MEGRKKSSKGKSFSLRVPDGQLITVENLPNKTAYNKGQSNFWFDTQKKIFYFREQGQKKEQSIQLSFQQEKYSYEGVTSANIYEIIIRTSLFSALFGSSGDSHVAVTEESMKLPFEEQPWFIGAVDKGELKSIELTETRMFFTRAKGPKMYLHWTTTKRMKNPERPILLESNDLSLVLPRGEFATARYNGGVIKFQNEVLFCRRVMDNNFKEAKAIFGQGVNLASLVLRSPNIISYYVENTPKELINEEMLIWLLHSGVFVDRDDKEIINVAATKCSDIAIEELLTHGIKGSAKVTQRAIERNIPPHRLRIYFKALVSTQYISFDYFFKIIKDYKTEDYSNRVLMTLAWRHGNEDNLFKLLPKELLQHIISYGVDDDMPWLDYFNDMNLTYLRHIDYHYRSMTLKELIKLGIIGWRYWEKVGTEISFIFQRIFDNRDNWQKSSAFYDNLSQSQMNLLVSWIIKLSSQSPVDKEEFMRSSFVMYLLNNVNSAPVVKSLLDSHTMKREWWTEPSDIGGYPAPPLIPLSWHALDPAKPNKALIQLLVRENLLPDECTLNNRLVGRSAYIRRESFIFDSEEVQALIDFIAECQSLKRSVVTKMTNKLAAE